MQWAAILSSCQVLGSRVQLSHFCGLHCLLQPIFAMNKPGHLPSNPRGCKLPMSITRHHSPLTSSASLFCAVLGTYPSALIADSISEISSRLKKVNILRNLITSCRKWLRGHSWIHVIGRVADSPGL